MQVKGILRVGKGWQVIRGGARVLHIAGSWDGEEGGVGGGVSDRVLRRA